MNRWDLINRLILKKDFKTYLEIGVQLKECFDKVIADKKICVDPEWKADFFGTSDDFFAQNKDKFDIVFIDGLHTAEQVYKDIENSLKISDYIFVHDCLPKSEEAQLVPRVQVNWNGSVWKGMLKLRERRDIRIRIINTDTGVGFITKETQTPIKVDNPTYEDFVENKNKWFEIITVEQYNDLLQHSI